MAAALLAAASGVDTTFSSDLLQNLPPFLVQSRIVGQCERFEGLSIVSRPLEEQPCVRQNRHTHHRRGRAEAHEVDIAAETVGQPLLELPSGERGEWDGQEDREIDIALRRRIPACLGAEDVGRLQVGQGSEQDLDDAGFVHAGKVRPRSSSFNRPVISGPRSAHGLRKSRCSQFCWTVWTWELYLSRISGQSPRST